MIKLSDKQMAEFLHRSYHAVDGLWFVKVEEKYGFDAALEVDNEVWKVLPKIQARMLKSMARMGDGLEALVECFTTKLALDGFDFTTEPCEGGKGVRISVTRCPWHEAMRRSRREELSGKVNSLICGTEYSVWASEFGKGLHFRKNGEICTGSERCLLEFVLS
ncbi:MAG: hypothetical protein DRI39_02285 [Chloroflexi bacterium]|nr:MAG: hypothetical protein DRI39_02285 [Chloroflexota bacterium]RLC95166.1 MAG: hypothetical protein DRI40_06390 [Chloroflexota bacterium]